MQASEASSSQVNAGPRPRMTMKRTLTWIITGIVALVILLVYLLGPAWSPITTIHDADGDGYPDAVDAKDNDATVWNYATATIVVTVENYWYDEAHYYIYLDGVQKAQGTIGSHDSVIVNLQVSWYYGYYSQKAFVVSAKLIVGEYKPTDAESVILTPGSIKEILLSP
jgi:hypothetical protein